MSAEIQAAARLSFAKGNLKNLMDLALTSFDMTGVPYERRSFSVPTSATAIPLGDVTTPGWFAIKNLDATNYVEIMTASGGSVCLKLKAGEFALFRFGVAAPALKANTAIVLVDYLLLQD